MTDRIKILPSELQLKGFDIWLNQWFLLTAGTIEDFNTMAIAWGSIGGMWTRPFIQVVVRPHRYTYEFMEKYDTFTVSSFPEKYKNDISILGSKSGRDCDKLKETALSICNSFDIKAPCFNEAELVFECKKMYYQDMNPDNFLDESIQKNYPDKDYHRIYFGEIISIFGLDKYSR